MRRRRCSSMWTVEVAAAAVAAVDRSRTAGAAGCRCDSCCSLHCAEHTRVSLRALSAARTTAGATVAGVVIVAVDS